MALTEIRHPCGSAEKGGASLDAAGVYACSDSQPRDRGSPRQVGPVGEVDAKLCTTDTNILSLSITAGQVLNIAQRQGVFRTGGLTTI